MSIDPKFWLWVIDCENWDGKKRFEEKKSYSLPDCSSQPKLNIFYWIELSLFKDSICLAKISPNKGQISNISPFSITFQRHFQKISQIVLKYLNPCVPLVGKPLFNVIFFSLDFCPQKDAKTSPPFQVKIIKWQRFLILKALHILCLVYKLVFYQQALCTF